MKLGQEKGTAFFFYYFLKSLEGLPPTRTARQPPLSGAAPLATYARQVPFDRCEY